MTRHLRGVRGKAEQDKAELAELEGVIERTLMESFVELGRALARIRDERLYKTAGFDRFEDYCRERWDLGRNYVNKQIAAAEVVGTMVPKGLPAPTNERQARELLKLDDPKAQVKAWATAVKTAPDGKVTARHVAAVVNAKLPSKAAKPPATTPVVAVSSPIDITTVEITADYVAGVRDGYDMAEAEILGHDDTGDSARAHTKPASALTALLDRYEREAREHQARSDDAFRRAQTAPMRSLGHKKQTCSDLRREALDEAIHARLFRQFARDLAAAMGLPPTPDMAERDDDENGGAQ